MSERSRQARELARHLTRRCGVEVTVQHDTGARWDLEWADGPTRHDMTARLDQALTEGMFSLLQDREIRLGRGWTYRAWAATAVAAIINDSDFPTDPYRIQSHVDDLMDDATDPQQARAVTHEPMIEQLLRHRYPHDMANALATDPDQALTGDDATIIVFPKTTG